jgi:hypothetical protein
LLARSYRSWLDVTPDQAKKLLSYLDDCHSLRNRLALDRLHNREWCEDQKHQDNTNIHFPNRADQFEPVSLYAKTNESWSWLHSQVHQNIACQVDECYKRFFEARRSPQCPSAQADRPKEIPQLRFSTVQFLRL